MCVCVTDPCNLWRKKCTYFILDRPVEKQVRSRLKSARSSWKKRRESSRFQRRNLSLAAFAAHLVGHPICIHIRRIRKSSWNDRLVNASIVSQRNAPRRKRTCLLCSLYATHQCLAVTISQYYDSATMIVFRSRVALPDALLKFRQKRVSTNTPARPNDIYSSVIDTTRPLQSYSIYFFLFSIFFVFFFFQREKSS